MKATVTRISLLLALFICVSNITNISAQTGCHAIFQSHQTENTLNVDFTDQSSSPNTIVSWAWDFGDGNTSTDQNPSHAYADAGTYTVCLTITDNHNCHNTICHSVIVEPLENSDCEALFDFNQVSNTLTVDFTDLSFSLFNITSWTWNFGDGSTSSQQNPSHTYAHAGNYEVCLTIHDDHGCSTTTCHSVTVQGVQSECHANFDFAQITNTLDVNFTDQSSSPNTILSWSWTFGDGSTSTVQNPSHTYSQDGNYEVCLTITDDSGCHHTNCHQITVHPLSLQECHAFFTSDQIANSLEVNFTDSSSSQSTIVSWDWNFGDGEGSLQQNPSHTYAQAGTYNVCLTITDESGCHNTYCHHITVHEMDEACHANFHSSQVNHTLDVNFSDQSGSQNPIISWFWDFGDGTTSTEQNPTHTYAQAGTYVVCLTINDDNECSDIYCHSITVHDPPPPPVCHASFTFHQEPAGTFSFTNTSGGTTSQTTYLWEFGDGETSTEENPVHIYSQVGNYTVCLFITDTAIGCNSHSCHVIHVYHAGVTNEALGSENSIAVKSKPNNDAPDKIINNEVLAYPNPMSNSLTIQFELIGENQISIEMYDILGNTKNKSTKIGTHGLNKEIINGENLSSGIYLLKLSVGEEVFMKKITIQK